jgi:plasmid stabilization system protein ParE
MKVYWTPGAHRRLQEIEAYIAANGSPEVARKVAIGLIRKTRMLEQPPLLGSRLAQYPHADVRQLLERPFRVIYRVSAERIEVLTVLHYRQLLPSDLRDIDAAVDGKPG